jgi:ATP-binding cassette subfamily B protein|tara:strand:- start:91 stop:1941 length:1851 start_codon:yes stop_codon:yes gene_type:complete
MVMQPMHPHALLRDPNAPEPSGISRIGAKRIWLFAAPYKWMIGLFVSAITVQALLQLVPRILFGRIIDDGIIPGNQKIVTTLALLTVAAALIEALFAIVERWLSAQVGEGLIHDLRATLFDHVQRMPLAFFTHTQTGTLVSRLNNDVIGAQRAVTGTLGTILSNLIVAVSTLVTMFILEWRLTFLALLLLPLFIWPAKRVGKKLSNIAREQMDRNAEMNSTMTERFSVSGAQLVKLFGNHDREATTFRHRAAAVRDLGIRSAMYGRAFMLSLGLVGAVGTALIYLVGGNYAINGDLSTGQLVTFAALVPLIYQPLTALTGARVDIMTALVSFERVFEVLDTPHGIRDSEEALDVDKVAGEVKFESVHFSYPTSNAASVSLGGNGSGNELGDEVLHDISLTLLPGTMTALVGPSGAGKSTLASLLPRLYEVSSGSIKIDNRDLRFITQESLRKNVGVVTQDPHLFHESVAANLRYSDPSASTMQMEEACRSAQIHDVIAALPDGYETVVGERGYRLSGGEKQRLAIARVLLKNPSIVILDEATSHLDAENELLVQQALDKALSGRTSLVIAHRLSTVRNADLIIVIDDGSVVEKGQHSDLISTGGLYADFHQTLSGN